MNKKGTAIQVLFMAKVDFNNMITALDELINAKKAALELSRKIMRENEYYKMKTRLSRLEKIILELHRI